VARRLGLGGHTARPPPLASFLESFCFTLSQCSGPRHFLPRLQAARTEATHRQEQSLSLTRQEMLKRLPTLSQRSLALLLPI